DQYLISRNQRTFLNPAGITDRYDINRDKKVNATDQLIARNHQTNFLSDLKLITAPMNAVTHLAADVFSPSEVRLTWLDNAQAESGYAIYAAKAQSTSGLMRTASLPGSFETAGQFV